MSFFSTTYRQLSLMFGLLLMVNAIVIILVFRHYSILPAGQQMGNFINQQMLLLEPLLKQHSLHEKQQYLATLYPDGKITASQIQPEHDLPPFKFYTAIRETLREKNITEIKYHAAEQQTTIWVKSSSYNPVWYGFAFEPFMRKARDMMRIIFLTLLIISLFGAYAFSRYSLRPLQRLAHIARSQSKDPDYMPEISVEGTKEVREVAQLVQRTIFKHRQLADEKQTFLAGVSHDLRTPLTRIRFQLEWLDDENIKNEIIEELNEMNQIIDDFMSYIKDPNSLSSPEGIAVKDLSQYIIDRYDSEQHDIQFDIENPDLLLAVHASHLKRVMMNLIDNAIHHGLPPIKITIRQSGVLALLTIQDHGPGLNNQQSHNCSYQGYGFGLKVVKKLLDMNGVEYSLESALNHGLTVHLKIPLK